MNPRLGFVAKKDQRSRYAYLRGTPANHQRAISAEDFQTILGELRNSPGPTALPVPPSKRPRPTAGPDHDDIRNMIREVGDMEGSISEVEYQMDGWRLDVAWKRIATGIPSHAFEVQIGGNFYEALAKLKHAYDKWNSKPSHVREELERGINPIVVNVNAGLLDFYGWSANKGGSATDSRLAGSAQVISDR